LITKWQFARPVFLAGSGSHGERLARDQSETPGLGLILQSHGVGAGGSWISLSFDFAHCQACLQLITDEIVLARFRKDGS
jgi:hypothetical protein